MRQTTTQPPPTQLTQENIPETQLGGGRKGRGKEKGKRRQSWKVKKNLNCDGHWMSITRWLWRCVRLQKSNCRK